MIWSGIRSEVILSGVRSDVGNYSSSPALGILADHLVRRGLFVAATAGGEDHLTQGEADQQTKSVVTEAK